MRKIIKISMSLLVAAVLLLAMLIWLIVSDEKRNTNLLISYRPTVELMEQLSPGQSGGTDQLLSEDETLLCVIGAYGSTQDFASLNMKQRESLPKSGMPSTDLDWYLLTFDEARISRIFLMNSLEIGAGVDGDDPGCVDVSGYYLVSTIDDNYGKRSKLSLNRRRLDL